MRLDNFLMIVVMAACGVEDKATDSSGGGGTTPSTQGSASEGTVGSTGSGASSGGASSGGATSSGGSSSTGGSAGLVWWMTCGDPACGGHTDKGLPACDPALMEGVSCDEPGAQCDPVNDCNAVFVCADKDPKGDTCPISRARFKREIDYVDGDARRRLYDELRQIRLATYRYREGDDAVATKLGLILEDGPPGPWIDEARGRVDLYAYTSLAIAALQVQAEEIAALRREVEALRAGECRPAGE